MFIALQLACLSKVFQSCDPDSADLHKCGKPACVCVHSFSLAWLKE